MINDLFLFIWRTIACWSYIWVINYAVDIYNMLFLNNLLNLENKQWRL